MQKSRAGKGTFLHSFQINPSTPDGIGDVSDCSISQGETSAIPTNQTLDVQMVDPNDDLKISISEAYSSPRADNTPPSSRKEIITPPHVTTPPPLDLHLNTDANCPLPTHTNFPCKEAIPMPTSGNTQPIFTSSTTRKLGE